ncbi:MAG TPA: NifB/NifX family molybdenum-iron cluster-binding protein [Candidatus Syntrophosphaera sp.]|nr:NifB/NifX family molybdenum-iron cluster-binding protein [Candidatus Syntrophosphaera sp.]
MKIAIPLTSGALSSHFGHCEAFAVYTVENGAIHKEEVVDPPVHEPGSHPAFLHQLGCSVVIAGGMGVKAQQLMCANGIQLVIGVPALPTRELVDQYLQGTLQPGDNRCEH